MKNYTQNDCVLNLKNYHVKEISTGEINVIKFNFKKEEIHKKDYCSFFQKRDISLRNGYLLGKLSTLTDNTVLLIYDYYEGRASDIYAYSYDKKGYLIDILNLSSEEYEKYDYTLIDYDSQNFQVITVHEDYIKGIEVARDTTSYTLSVDGLFIKNK
ncbi:hypothetical protein [Flammeovirga sp. SJP92]|uniref:hypothetical protein n=1 Tax=Flammeovirga sp. SJP92 TaxID=1775430 RepID=UPI0007870D94|nr:hypothetical protein [Flammeovirga sp. SJP92]KXX69237.1 hypothetical protein AVL50_16375 [Flammeovirga sp. SJP92]